MAEITYLGDIKLQQLESGNEVVIKVSASTEPEPSHTYVFRSSVTTISIQSSTTSGYSFSVTSTCDSSDVTFTGSTNINTVKINRIDKPSAQSPYIVYLNSTASTENGTLTLTQDESGNVITLPIIRTQPPTPTVTENFSVTKSSNVLGRLQASAMSSFIIVKNGEMKSYAVQSWTSAGENFNTTPITGTCKQVDSDMTSGYEVFALNGSFNTTDGLPSTTAISTVPGRYGDVSYKLTNVTITTSNITCTIQYIG